MKKLVFLPFLLLLFLFPPLASAQSAPQTSQSYMRGTVTAVTKQGTRTYGEIKNLFQQVSVKITSGRERGKTVSFENGGMLSISRDQLVHPGDKVILSKLTDPAGHTQYVIYDQYRLPTLLMIIGLFFVLVFIFSGLRGFGATLGLLISLLTIAVFIIPQILAGHDPLTVSITGALFIMITSIYLAHGFSKRTTIAVTATFISLILTGVLAVIFVNLAHLSGLGSDDASMLQVGVKTAINLRGLLLGGVIIGALGVLDDTTTTQAATIFELIKTDPNLSVQQLVHKGFLIGREHIASLVNTLVLAYAGAAMGVFIFIILSLKSGGQPWWVIFNSELIAEELVRTMAGSIGIVLAVPITTYMAAVFGKYRLF